MGAGGAITTTVRSLRVVNVMYDVDIGHPIGLDEAYHQLTTTTACTCKLYHGRPQMLLVYLPLWRRNIQVFAKGKIQVMGRVSPSDALSMIISLCLFLNLLPPPPHHRQLILILRNLVISAQLNNRIHLARFPHSAGSRDAFYEPELFPALQINKWTPLHIAVFASGHCVIAGLTTFNCAYLCSVLTNLVTFLSSYNLFIAD